MFLSAALYNVGLTYLIEPMPQILFRSLGILPFGNNKLQVDIMYIPQSLLTKWFQSTLLVPPQARPVHSRWFAPLWGMGFLWHRDCSLGFLFPTHSTLASILLVFLAAKGSGALLSSNLE